MIKLYELTGNYRQLVELAEETDSTAFVDTLQSIQDEIEDRTEKMAFVIRTLEANAKVIKEEEQRLADRRKAYENKVSSLKQYLQDQLEVAGLNKVKRPTITVAIQNNPPSVEVADEQLIPANFFIEQAPKLDKKSLLQHLKDGHEVPGARIQQTKGLRIR
jgi:hypothetical protein